MEKIHPMKQANAILVGTVKAVFRSASTSLAALSVKFPERYNVNTGSICGLLGKRIS